MQLGALRVIGGSLLTFAIVWALVLGWWQSNDTEPSKLDLALYLGAFPVALIGGYLLLRSFIEHLKAPQTAIKVDAPVLQDDDPLSAASAKTAALERAFTICLVDGFVVTAVGVSADDVLGAVSTGQRPEPSFRLSDEAGFPVFLAAVDDLDVEGMIEKISGGISLMHELADHDDIVRALALLDRLLGEVQERLNPLLVQSAELLKLHVMWLLPSNWSGSLFAGLTIWLQLNYWPDLGREQLKISLIPVANEVDALMHVDDVILQLNRDPANNELILLLGAVSAVDEKTVENRLACNILFSAKHQDRKIPGEGAVGLLLASRPTAERLESAELTIVSRVSMGGRNKPIDAGGRINGKLIEQLLVGLLDVTGIENGQIKSMLFDADHRANRVSEAMEGVGQTLEHLDPIEDCHAIGTVTGDLSPIGSLIALACARSKVLATEAPVLCLSNQHERDRALVLAMPHIANPKLNQAALS